METDVIMSREGVEILRTPFHPKEKCNGVAFHRLPVSANARAVLSNMVTLTTCGY